MSDTLEKGEVHPMSERALAYIQSFPTNELLILKEAIENMSIQTGYTDRAAEVCMGTMNRLINREPVSDRYLLGLAWFLMEIVTLQNQLLEADEDEHLRTIETATRTH